MSVGSHINTMQLRYAAPNAARLAGTEYNLQGQLTPV